MREGFRAMGWVDYPDRSRKLHGTPIPRLGGFPISIAFFSSILLLHWAPTTLAEYFRTHADDVYKIFLPSLVVLALGAWDDIRGLSPYAKLAVQIAAGYWLYAQGLSISHIGVPGTSGIHLGVFSLPVTLLWIVGITNAFNLVDGLDGLASGVAFFAATTMFVVAVLQRNIELTILTASLSGATLAFLRFNFNPATVFLGDSGSYFLGFLLAAFALLWQAKASTLVAVVAPLLTLGLPIAEVGISVFRRLVRGQPVFSADREHIHHRLLGQGLTPRRAAVVLYMVCGVLSIISLLLANWQTRDTGLILLVLVAAGWLGVQQLGYHEFGEMGDSIRRGLFQQRRMIDSHVRLRNLGHLLQQAAQWEDLLAILRDAGRELGFHEMELDLSGKNQPLGIAPVTVISCVVEDATVTSRSHRHPERFWRVNIPVGSREGDNSRLIFASELSATSTPYLVSTLVQVISSSLPQVIDRMIASYARQSAVPSQVRPAHS